jgi:uncharacterized protein (TIGR03663 family)
VSTSPALREPGGGLRLPGTLPWLLVGALCAARFVALGDRPLHHDEGVNAWKLSNVLAHGVFEYDPSNYHGPSLFFMQVIPTALWWLAQGDWSAPLWRGITEVSLRSLVATFGCLILAGMLAARDRLGATGGVVAAALAGLSCSMLYYSRDFIHEILFVAFTLGLYLAGGGFARTGRRLDLCLASASAALVFCTKETSVLTFAAMGAAAVAAALLRRRGPGEEGAFATAREDLRRLLALARPHLWVAALVGVGIWLALYSSFFMRLQGIPDSLATFRPWARTALESGHEKEWHYFFSRILGRYEPALSVCALPGILFAAVRRDREGLFLSAWAALTLGGYSAIPYKTPWLVLNALLPMSLLAGWGAQQLLDWGSGLAPRVRWVVLGGAGVALIALLGVQAKQTARVVYQEYDDSLHPLVYSQTVRDLRRLLVTLEAKAAVLPGPVAIDGVAKEYWPLPFYLREYQARFWESPKPDAAFVIANPSQGAELAEALGDGWTRTGYDLRPGVRLELWSRASPPGR